MRSKETEDFCIGITKPKQKYKHKIPISEAKKKDLLDLCKDGTIPEDFHSYYDKLPSSVKVKDKVPEPDLYDDEIQSDDDN